MHQPGTKLSRCLRQILRSLVVYTVGKIGFFLCFVHSRVTGTVDDKLNAVLFHKVKHSIPIGYIKLCGIGIKKTKRQIPVFHKTLNRLPQLSTRTRQQDIPLNKSVKESFFLANGFCSAKVFV